MCSCNAFSTVSALKAASLTCNPGDTHICFPVTQEVSSVLAIASFPLQNERWIQPQENWSPGFYVNAHTLCVSEVCTTADCLCQFLLSPLVSHKKLIEDMVC